jgi:hypothetical protein
MKKIIYVLFAISILLNVYLAYTMRQQAFEKDDLIHALQARIQAIEQYEVNPTE